MKARALPCLLGALLLLSVPGRAQSPGDPVEPVVPPRPSAPSPPEEESREEPASREADPLEELDSDRPWGLPPGLLESLARRAEAYRDHATRFTSVESVRGADYDREGEASDESVRRYAYLLERSEGGDLRESRQRLKTDGSVRGGDVEDPEVFPPAYAWVFLFGRDMQPWFAYRDMGERYEGFHWVRVVHFRGALPFTDGKDIRQWEGRALVDAVTGTPVEILAQPGHQRERLRGMFERWAEAFNLVGAKLAPRPFAYRGRVQFRLVRDGLTFPTELRYDTLRAVSRNRLAPVRASTRTYESYRFFRTETEAVPGETVDE